MRSPDVCFVGMGYIGLPTAVVMANHGLTVTGVDVNASVVERINRGEATIAEPGLELALNEAVDSGHLTASTTMVHANVYVVAVPTPFTENHEGDLSYVLAAAESIAPTLQGGELVILESTSPPLSTQKMAEKVLGKRPDLVADGVDNPEGKPVVYFAHCPERILPGNSMAELVTNDRVIGGATPEATRRATEVYATFCDGELLPTNDVTAEMTKLTENSFRDVNIAFANELSLIADRLGIDVWKLIELANHHPRVNILQPGPGVGGHCIAVDPWFIVSADPENARLIRMAREVNDGKPAWVVERVQKAAEGLQEPNIAILGLTFKANVDDLRKSPALEITRSIVEHMPHARLLAADPYVTQLPNVLTGKDNISLATVQEAVDSADIVVHLVDHREYQQFAPADLVGKAIIDTRGSMTKPSPTITTKAGEARR